MVSDNLGLAAAVALAYLSRNALKDPNWLPLAAFPLLAAGDLFSIHRSLKAIHLRTLNKERAELIAHRCSNLVTQHCALSSAGPWSPCRN